MLVDVIIEVLEKHKIDKSVIDDELAQALASDVGEQLQDMDAHNVWSTEAKSLLHDVVTILSQDKEAMLIDTTERRELGNLIFKIEELLIKH